MEANAQRLSKELALYMQWIERFQERQEKFTANVFQIMQAEIGKVFRREFEVELLDLPGWVGFHAAEHAAVGPQHPGESALPRLR